METKPVLCIVGLGYVGLPLAAAFARHGYEVHGYDVAQKRIDTLKAGHDWTNELSSDDLTSLTIDFSTDPTVIAKADIVILALPTPVDDSKKPDLSILESATHTVGKNLKKGAIVVYESTVYPGVTEELCGPILAKESGLTMGTDFTLGYSPERINPGDKEHTVETIIKIVAGQDEKTLSTLADLYGSIVKAGIHRAPSIKVAEMAKAIENAQRDLNIAFVNEIAQLCHRLGIASKDVLEAAGTKWNFLKFQPGLVGGHCIGVDPYYLVEKAAQLGMQTEVIAAGRATNDGMSRHVANQVHELLGTPGKILVLGVTFKENVPDSRNSKVKDVANALIEKKHEVKVLDPFYSPEELTAMGYVPGVLENDAYDAILLLVPHKAYNGIEADLIRCSKENGVVYDLKSIVNRSAIEQGKRRYLSL